MSTVPYGPGVLLLPTLFVLPGFTFHCIARPILPPFHSTFLLTHPYFLLLFLAPIMREATS